MTVLGGASVLATATLATAAEKPALKDLAPKTMRIGAALNQDESDGKDKAALAIVTRHFNQASPENLLKWASVHPEPDRYDFGPADRYVELGQRHGLFVVGHVLVWHQQTPAWVFAGEGGKKLDRETALARLASHVATVVGRYKGRIGGWDVVNEALDEDGTLRKTPWLEAIGEDYIAKAFELAHEADPGAELYYNDYNLWKPAKRDAAIRLVKGAEGEGPARLRPRRAGALGHRGPAARRHRRDARGDARGRDRRPHHRARHGRPAPRSRHVGGRPLEEGDHPREDEHLPRRPAAGGAGDAGPALRGRVRPRS